MDNQVKIDNQVMIDNQVKIETETGQKPAGSAGKAMIAMSGGVDSSVAALLMKQAGYACMGVRMELYSPESEEPSGDNADAKRVADRIGMPFCCLDYRELFKDQVIRRFVESYECGATPNPCIECNRYIKFGRLMTAMAEMGCDYIVTGHYARIQRDPQTGRYLVFKAKDISKDQSYVLYHMTQDQLAHTLLPLGEYTKAEIRQIAEEHGFVNARKHDSQDICFVPDGKYASFIEAYRGRQAEPGDFVLQDGTVMGRHKGLIRYTIGQRRGLGLSLTHSMYVCAKDIEKNQVIIGENEDLFSTELDADQINFIPFDHLDQPIRCTAKTRYKQKEVPAVVTQTGPDRIHVSFETPVRGITRGQSVVLYDEDMVIGGGVIL